MPPKKLANKKGEKSPSLLMLRAQTQGILAVVLTRDKVWYLPRPRKAHPLWDGRGSLVTRK